MTAEDMDMIQTRSVEERVAALALAMAAELDRRLRQMQHDELGDHEELVASIRKSGSCVPYLYPRAPRLARVV
jgi:hypothetical protein